MDKLLTSSGQSLPAGSVAEAFITPSGHTSGVALLSRFSTAGGIPLPVPYGAGPADVMPGGLFPYQNIASLQAETGMITEG